MSEYEDDGSGYLVVNHVVGSKLLIYRQVQGKSHFLVVLVRACFWMGLDDFGIHSVACCHAQPCHGPKAAQISRPEQ